MKIKIREDYSISVIYNGESLPKSGGENQLVSLVFTAALVWFAKLRVTAEGEFLLPGTLAPLVLDAPFGQLDDDYQPQVAKVIPDLGHQVILLVSGSQGNEKVISAFENKIGSDIILRRHTTKSPSEVEPKSVTVDGEKHPQVFYNEEFDYSSIKVLY